MYRFGEMFSGAGGMSLGAHTAAEKLGIVLEPMWALDRDADACATYSKNIAPVAKHCDVRQEFKDRGADCVEPVDIFAFGFPCFVAGTLVTTSRGAIPIEDVVVGDLVLTHLGRWRRVLRTMVKDGAEVVGLRTPAMSEATLVTPEHPFWTDARSFAPVSTLDKGHYVARVRPVEAPPSPWDENSRVGALAAEPDFWHVVGLYLGDGRARVTARSATVEIRRPEGRHHALEAVLARLGFSWECRFQRGTFKVIVSDRDLAEVCLFFGDKPHERGVPAWVHSLSKWHRTRLLDGWMMSSGSFVRGRRVCITCSKGFAIEMARVLEATTGTPSCVYLNRSTRALSSGAFRHRYQVHHVETSSKDRKADGEAAWFKVKSIEPVEGTYTVHNLEVEEDNSYHANGYAVHNCNDYSSAGSRLGMTGEYGPLYRYALDVLQVHRPMAFVAENVSELRSAKDEDGGQRALDYILKDFTDAGYRLTPHLYRAEDYGVPQTRHRVIIAGVRSDADLPVFRVPAPSHSSPVPSSVALAKIPEWATGHAIGRVDDTVARRLSYIPPGGNLWCGLVPEELMLGPGTRKMSLMYRRLHPDRPSPTITAAGGGGTHGYHWEENRPLTNRERARIQTFPDSFEFVGNQSSVRRQIGMAVPPLLAEAVFVALFRTLRSEDYPCSSASLATRGARALRARGNSKASEKTAENFRTLVSVRP